MNDFKLTAKDIAKILHGLTCQIRRYDNTIVDKWEDLSEEFKELSYNAVREVYSTPQRSPEELHNLWMGPKLKDGWKLGDHNIELKMHPCLVPFSDLPPSEICKDLIWHHVTEAFRPFYTEEDCVSVLVNQEK